VQERSNSWLKCGAQLAYQATPKILDEELSPSIIQNYSLSFISHKMGGVYKGAASWLVMGAPLKTLKLAIFLFLEF
jgi:hypothetical protein